MEEENRKRRVSILKPTKSRQPLSELDLGNQNPDEQLTSDNKTLRRVSFASNNFIKPFVADDEENTIWDHTYEESIEKSESSHSVEAITNDHIRKSLNMTIMNGDDDMDVTANVNQLTIAISNISHNSSSNNKEKDDLKFEAPINCNLNIQNEQDDNHNLDTPILPISTNKNIWNQKVIDCLDVNIEETNMIPILISETTPNNFARTINQTENIDCLDMSMEETVMIPISLSERIQTNSVGTVNQKENIGCLDVNMEETEMIHVDCLDVSMEETEMICVSLNEATRNNVVRTVNQKQNVDCSDVSIEETEMIHISIRETSNLIGIDNSNKSYNTYNLDTAANVSNKDYNFVAADVLDTMNEIELVNKTPQSNFVGTDHSNKSDKLSTAVNIYNKEDKSDCLYNKTPEVTHLVISETSQKTSNSIQEDDRFDNNELEVPMDQTLMVSTLIDVKSQNGSENLLPTAGSMCTSCDDTERLINYNLSNPKNSDFSKVISGDLNPSFCNLSLMPLRGINSTSFVENCLKELGPSDSSENMKEGDQNTPVQDMNMPMGDVEIEDETNTSVITSKKSISIKCNNRDSDRNTNKVSSEYTVWETYQPLDLTWIDNFEKVANRIKAKQKEYEKLLGDCLQETNQFYERENEKYDNIKEMLKLIEDHENKLKNRQHELIEESKPKQVVTDESKVSTFEDKIIQLHKRSEEYWNIVSLDEEAFKFNTLFKTIVFTVQVNADNGQVLNIELENRISGKSEPIALYVNKIFIEKLQLKAIQAALGEKFEILSLLDYVRITMENLLSIDKDYTYLSNTYAVSISRDFSVTFAIIGVNSMFSWRFTINASDYENITTDCVSYYAKIGSLREHDIKKCMQNCPKGFSFIRCFVENLNNFVETLENNLRK